MYNYSYSQYIAVDVFVQKEKQFSVGIMLILSSTLFFVSFLRCITYLVVITLLLYLR